MWDEGISQDLYADNLIYMLIIYQMWQVSGCQWPSLLVIVEVTMYFWSEHVYGTSFGGGGSTEHHTQSPLC